MILRHSDLNYHEHQIENFISRQKKFQYDDNNPFLVILKKGKYFKAGINNVFSKKIHLHILLIKLTGKIGGKNGFFRINYRINGTLRDILNGGSGANLQDIK